jgi:Catechol dioxygenase N terminus
MSTIQFLTRTGQTCTSLRQEFILLSDVLGVSALIDARNNPTLGNATESSVLGPFFTDDAPDGSSAPPLSPPYLTHNRLTMHPLPQSPSASR